MAPRNRTWLKGCGIGCGIVIILGLVGTFGASMLFMGPMRDAIESREELESRHGDQAAYVPPADGAVTGDRLERFLRVRQDLMATCEGFEATSRQFERMDELSDDASSGEVLGEMKGLMGEVFGMVPRLGKFFEARNAALLSEDMGLGEYTYVYVCAYHDQLRNAATSDEVFGDAEISRRAHQALRSMLQSQLAAMPPDHPQRPSLGEELDRLREHPRSLPWYHGLPATVSASLEPHRARLDAVFCEFTTGLEFNTNRTRGPSVISE